jgi:hypothetical protein
MVPVTQLWLPILLAAVLVFVASSIIHMVLGYHAGDYKKVPREDEALAAMRPFNLEPGDYCMPRAGSMSAMKDPEFRKKWAAGPVMFFTVMPNGSQEMAPQFIGWFVYTLFIGMVAAYVTGLAYGPGTDYMRIFRMATTVAFIGYGGTLPQFSIWYKRSWRTTIVGMVDSLIFGMLTAGALGWLWPR